MVFKRERLATLEETPPEVESKRHTIMLVDDEEPNLKILSVLLGNRYRILTAFSAEEALETLDTMNDPEEEVSLIMCDQRMAGMTGVAFFERVNELIPKTKRILVTGYLDMEALISSINEAHIYKFITKPFNRADLMLSVKRAIEAYEMETELEGHVKNLEEKVRMRTLELQKTNEQLRSLNKALEQASLTDPLTGLKNRRFLLKNLEADIAIVRRAYRDTDQSTSPERADLLFFMLDLDHFKEVNDTHGHAAGDRVLLQVREVLERVFRESDFLVRWGGEEFLVIARFVDRASAELLAERIRAAIESHPFDLTPEVTIQKTCSIGFTCFPFDPRAVDLLTWSQVVDLADRCLYAAKHSGRNAWVGLHAADRACAQHFFEDWMRDPATLITAGEARVSTSLREVSWEK